jgi:DNA-directed RNA polymerase specialized sigma subunit
MVEKGTLTKAADDLPEKSEIERKVTELTERLGMSKNEALKELSAQYHVPKRTLYNLLLSSTDGEE